jgi:hypothetical protein
MAMARGGIILLGLSGALLGVAGCGDDDGAKLLSQEEFVEQANEICAAANQRTGAIAADIGPDSTAEELDAVVTAIADDSERLISDLRALRPPTEVSDELTAALDQAETDLQELRDLGGAVFSQATDPFNETNSMMDRLGLTACAGSSV